MTLDVFDIKLGTDVMPRLDAETTGLVAVKMLDAVQTIADVLTVNDGGAGYRVSFDPGMNAYTDRGERRIVVSAKPMLDARPGTPMSEVAAVMAGFVVHEVGHTGMDYFTAVKKEWPGKALPLVLANIIEDVVLELRTVRRYRGFADQGEGNIFRPTLEWVAKLTSPKTPLVWSGSTGHKVNVTGQIVRYRDFVTFSTDPVTQTHLRWVEEWMTGIHHDLTPSGCVELIRAWFDHAKATAGDDIPEPEPEGKPDKSGSPTETDQTLPNEDDDTEGDGEGAGDDDGDETGDGNGEAEDSDEDDADGDGTEGDSDEDGDDEGDGEAEDGDGSGTGDRGGDGNDADTMNRTESDKGSNDGDGAGGSGQSIAEASDPVDDYVESDLPKTFDDMSKPENSAEQHTVHEAEQVERVTTRVDAGAFGKMRVVFK